MKTYSTLNEYVNQVVIPILGKWVWDFDVEEIALRATGVDNNGRYYSKVTASEFWVIVEECELIDELSDIDEL